MLSVIIDTYQRAQKEQEETRKNILNDPIRQNLFHDHLDMRDMNVAQISGEVARKMSFEPSEEEKKVLSILYPWKKAVQSALDRIVK